MIRSCDAFGIDGLVTFGHAVDPFEPRTARSTAGSLFSLPIAHLGSHEQRVGWIEALRAHALATLLLFGSEARGPGRRLQDLADACVSIPMEGAASSLNLACAGTTLLVELHRQRS